MKILKITATERKIFENINFKAGKTNLYSDFDGTYMPKEFNHDYICNKEPEVNREEFNAYFQRLQNLFETIRGTGTERKLNFVLTTGRNIHEQNYYFDKIKEQRLRVPLPDSLITCNGEDEFYLDVNSEDEFYNNPQKQAFLKENVNTKKREYYRQRGWDYQKTKAILTKLLQEKQLYTEKNFNNHTNGLASHIKSYLSINELQYKNLLKELQEPNLSEKQVRKILEKYTTIKGLEGKKAEKYDWYMGILGNLVWNELNSKITIIDNVPTTRSSKEYGNNLSLESKMEEAGLHKGNEIYAFSDDGELGIRVAVNSNYNANITNRNNGNRKNLKILFHEKISRVDITKLKKGSYLDNEFEVKPLGIDKYNDTKTLVDKITKEGSNDLVIVAGDGSNDLKMLSVAQYIANTPEPQAIFTHESVERLKNTPLVVIYIDNRTTEEKLDTGTKIHELVSNGDFFNYDGNLRFIHVDSSDPNKPHTLEEATKLAIYSYAQRNEEFKKNLSPEMQEIIANYEMTYPINEEIAKKAKEIYSIEHLDALNFKRNLSTIATEYDKISKMEEKYNLKDIELECCKENSNISAQDKSVILASLLLIILRKKDLIKNLSQEKIEEQIIKADLAQSSKTLKKAISYIKNEFEYLQETEIRKLKTAATNEYLATRTRAGNSQGSPSTPSNGNGRGQIRRNSNPENPIRQNSITKKVVNWVKRHKFWSIMIAISSIVVTATIIKNKAGINNKSKDKVEVNTK